MNFLKRFFTTPVPHGFVVDEVRSVIPSGQAEVVYDFTTEDHEFTANGILVHNCHQAAWCISHSSDNSERGHGPVWQQWMVDVGLDPRRFDPTDSSEYSLNTPRASEDEARFTRTYGGPRLPDAVIDKAEKAKKLKNHREGPCTIILQGRILDGTLSGNVFTGKNRSTERQVSLQWGRSRVGNEIFYELST